jgi:hypothetical protein
MNNTATLAARLRDLQARSEATDRSAAAALSEVQAAGAAVAAAMAALANAAEAE